MSAIELIRAIEGVIPQGAGGVRAPFFTNLQTPTRPAAGNGNTASGSGNWPDFGERLKRIYGTRVVAGSESVISDARRLVMKACFDRAIILKLYVQEARASMPFASRTRARLHTSSRHNGQSINLPLF
jgi:hypothetical protein